MPTTLELCMSNSAEPDSADETRDIVVRRRRCLEQCGICREQPFAVVDGQVIREQELPPTLSGGDENEE